MIKNEMLHAIYILEITRSPSIPIINLNFYHHNVKSYNVLIFSNFPLIILFPYFKMVNWPQTYSQLVVVLVRDLPILSKISSAILVRLDYVIPVICQVVDSSSEVFFGHQRYR